MKSKAYLYNINYVYRENMFFCIAYSELTIPVQTLSYHFSLLTKPHARQWCLRFTIENCEEHRMHFTTPSIGVRIGGSCPNSAPPPPKDDLKSSSPSKWSVSLSELLRRYVSSMAQNNAPNQASFSSNVLKKVISDIIQICIFIHIATEIRSQTI